MLVEGKKKRHSLFFFVSFFVIRDVHRMIYFSVLSGTGQPLPIESEIPQFLPSLVRKIA